jgi:hypothetical protein
MKSNSFPILLFFLPVPRDAHDPVDRDRVVTGHHDVVAVRQMSYGSCVLQQPRAALYHVSASEAVVAVQLDETKLANAAVAKPLLFESVLGRLGQDHGRFLDEQKQPSLSQTKNQTSNLRL